MWLMAVQQAHHYADASKGEATGDSHFAVVIVALLFIMAIFMVLMRQKGGK